MFKRLTLLRKQKKQVFHILQEVGLNPLDFAWEKQTVADTYTVSLLRYRDPSYFFQFSWFDINAWCLYAPARFRLQEQEHPRTWQEQETIFSNWAHYLKEELETPDLWQELSQYRLILSTALPDSLQNDVISAGAAERINQQLGILAEQIVTNFSLEGNDRTFVLSRIGYLGEALKRQLSLDWMYTCLGICTTMAHSLDLSPHATLALWEHFRDTLGSVFALEKIT